jgi:hypothetical protein
MRAMSTPELTPEKPRGTPMSPVSVAVFLGWRKDVHARKYRYFYPEGKEPTTVTGLQTEVLQALCRHKLLRDSAMAYDTVPEGVPPTPANILPNVSELSLLQSTVETLKSELAAFRDFVATVIYYHYYYYYIL